MEVETLDQTKVFVKEAIAEGRKRQSSVTGFVHYTFEDPSKKEAIPLYENIVFALALCRSNLVDHILEAKDLLLKLYPFFKKVGAFGVYLHEWPAIKKPVANVKFLLPLLHIQREYGHVMGNCARETLTDILNKLFLYVKALDLPPHMRLQKEVFDAVYHHKKMPTIDQKSFLSTKDYSELIIMAPFLDQRIVWPRCDALRVFAGSYHHELQRTTLYDLYFHKKAREDEITPLYGALIYPFEVESFLPARLNDWQNIFRGETLFGFLTKYKPKEGRISPGHHLFHITTDQNTLVCQTSHAKVDSYYDNEALVCEFTIHENENIDFFMAYDDKECLRVDGEKATFFELGDSLSIMGLKITFEKISGLGRMCGHFLRGNRPGQKCPKIKSEWAAYDWQISLTVLELLSPMQIKVTIKKARD